MAVYLFTFHAYRSWMPDHRRGYVRRGRGILNPDQAMAANYRRRARFEAVRFDDHDCQTLLDAAQTLCQSPARAGWRLHTGVAVFNHVHLLVSWRGYVAAQRAKAALHRALTVELRDAHDAPPGRPWLARNGSIKRITTRRHFEHLLHTYLPSHRKYGGALLIPPA
ncbi:MAG: hypothetical protein WD042_09720 [Phycisphaeraceae bacterium]